MTELKPCPFCGGQVTENSVDWHGFDKFQCYCVECGARVSGHLTKEEAIEAWNRRAVVPNIPVKSGYIILPVPDKMLPCSPDGDLSEAIKAYSYVVSRHIQDKIVTESLRLNGYVRIDGVKEDI